MSTDYKAMNTADLMSFARGFLEAIEDGADSLNQLCDHVAKLSQQLMAPNSTTSWVGRWSDFYGRLIKAEV